MATVEFNLSVLIGTYSLTLDLNATLEGDVKNGHVIFLLVEDNFNLVNVSKKLLDYFNHTVKKPLTLNNVRMRCRRLVENYKTLKKHYVTNWDTIKKLLEEPFLALKRVLTKRKANFPPPAVPELPVCCHRELQRDAFLQSISDLKAKLLSAKRTIRELRMKKVKKVSMKRMNQKLKRKETIIQNCKKLRSSLASKVLRLQAENERLKALEERCLKDRNTLKKEVRSLKKSLDKKASMISKLKVTIEKLTQQLDELMDCDTPGDEDDHKLRKVYGVHIRKCLFTCLESNVPVEKAGHLVKFILKELTKTVLTRFPAPNTIAQMAYEMGILSDLQVAEWLYTSPPDSVATIGWDATTIDGFHYNEMNISLNGKTMTLEIGKLAGGSTSDYAQHILETLDSLSFLYSKLANLEQKVVLEKFNSLFHSTMSDRAPVNNCVSDKLSQVLQKPLVKLHCSVHPMDGLATGAKETCKCFDARCSTPSEIFGTEGRAANLILAVGKLR